MDAGGHNILEPAVFGKPIVFGPHMENFAEIAQTFLDNGAAIQIRDERELEPVLIALARRSGATREPRRRGAGARRGQSRRSRQEPCGPGRAAASRVIRRRAALPGRALRTPRARGAALLSDLYAAAARRRRERYARRPDLRRRLRRPVVSVGNLAVGGRGKTPTVACLARLAASRRASGPSILTRGYARTQPEDGVVVVSDPDGTSRGPRAGRRRAADARAAAAWRAGARLERSLPRRTPRRASVRRHRPPPGRRVSAPAARSGRRPRHRRTARISTRAPGRCRPAGCAKRQDALAAADAVLADGPGVDLPGSLDVPLFTLRRRLGDPVVPARSRDSTVPGPGVPAVAVAGIADPERFLKELAAGGWTVQDALVFRDHHRIHAERRRADLGGDGPVGRPRRGDHREGLRPSASVPAVPVAVAYLPLTMEPEPAAEFRRWLEASLQAARDITVD